MSFEDQAQNNELREWEIINAPRPAPVKYQPGDQGYGPEFCARCDSDMPDARREHGFHICRPCKEVDESKGSRIR